MYHPREERNMDNIINFPKQNFESFPTTEQQSVEHLETVRSEYCDAVVGDALEAVIGIFNSYGFTLRPDKNSIKDTVFLEETMKAFIYRQKHLEHPFHQIIESAISLPDEIQTQIDEKIKDKQLT